MPNLMANRTLKSYIRKEYFLSFLIAFMFFFFIFFINQILLIAQRILLKNVDITQVLKLISYAIPQIMLYTIPFSSLTAASMLIGDLSSNNEITALRSVGISIKTIFKPILTSSLVLVVLTFLVADVLLPYSMVQYRKLYVQLLQDMPTLEMDSYKANKVGNMVIIAGKVEDDNIDSLLMFSVDENEDRNIINSKNAKILVEDPKNFIYKIDVNNPQLFTYNSDIMENYTYANAKSMTYYLDFSKQVPNLTDYNPSQLSSKDLLREMKNQRLELEKSKIDVKKDFMLSRAKLVSLYQKNILNKEFKENADIEFDYLNSKVTSLEPIYYEYQYYRAEFAKKFVLSFACFFLVFIAFPISFFKVKHGRLIGFGLSMIVAVAFWFILFFAQLRIFDTAVNPVYIMHLPNAIIFGIATILLLRLNK